MQFKLPLLIPEQRQFELMGEGVPSAVGPNNILVYVSSN